MKKACRICGVFTQVVGKTKGLSGEEVCVYHCEQCNVQFIPLDPPPRLYDKLYTTGEIGYHHDVSKDGLSLLELAYKDTTFGAVFENLPYAGTLDILEIGCGYGFLTNALIQHGTHARGIDVSEKCIAYARERYGGYFEKKTITEMSEGTFDMIIAIEVIEHVVDPLGFVTACMKRLKPDGKFLLTTPNKDFYRRGTVWLTNPYPVHLFWFGKRAMQAIAERTEVKLVLLPHERYCMKYTNENLLVDWLKSRIQSIKSVSVFDDYVSDAHPAPFSKSFGALYRFVQKFIRFGFVRWPSNMLFLVRPRTKTLAVMFVKPL